MEEELTEVLFQKNDKVILKYTVGKPERQVPVDKLQSINKLRPVAISAESEVRALTSFHDETV